MVVQDKFEPTLLPTHGPLLIYGAAVGPELGDGQILVASLSDSWPADIMEKAAGSCELILADPLSFPYEAMSSSIWEVPMSVLLPDRYPPELVGDLLAEPLFAHFTIFDRLITDDDAAWAYLKARFSLLEVQRIRRFGRDTSQVVSHLEKVRTLIEEADVTYDRPTRQIDRWALRTVANKKKHLLQRQALVEQVVGVRSRLPGGVGMRVGHFGVGVGRFHDIYRNCRVTGFDSTGWVIDQARFNSETTEAAVLGPGRRTGVRRGSFDLTVGVHVITAALPDDRRSLLAEMWRVTRRGGRLVILDDVVTDDAIGTRALLNEVFDVTGGSVVLSDVSTLRYDSSGRVDDALFSFMPVFTVDGS